MVIAAAWTFVVLSALVMVFQLAVAAGTPWGHLTQGGRHTGTLPASGRIMAAVSAVLVVGMVTIVLARAGLWDVSWQASARVSIWIVVALSALTVLANAASKSKGERALWLPIGLVLLAASIVIAVGV